MKIFRLLVVTLFFVLISSPSRGITPLLPEFTGDWYTAVSPESPDVSRYLQI